MSRRLVLLLTLLGPAACATAPIDNRPFSKAPSETYLDDHPLSDTAVVLAFDPDMAQKPDIRETSILGVDHGSLSTAELHARRWVRVLPGPHLVTVSFEVALDGGKGTTVLTVPVQAQPRHVYVLIYDLEEHATRASKVRCAVQDLGESPDVEMEIGPPGTRVPVRFTADEQPK